MTILLASALLLIQSPPIDEKRVDQLVEQCGAEAIADREAASKELAALGDPVIPLLEKRLKELADGLAKTTLLAVVDQLTESERLARRFVEEDTDGRAVDLENQLQAKMIDPAKAAKFLRAVILHDSPRTHYRRYALSLAQRHGLPDIWPAVIKVVARDPGNTNLVLMTQVFAPPAEALPEIWKLIPRIQSAPLCASLLEAAARLRPDPAALEEILGGLLGSGDAHLRTAVASSIQLGRVPIAFPTLVKFWRAHPLCRPHLREPILRVPPAEAAAEVVGFLKMPDPESVQLALDFIRGQASVTPVAPALVDPAPVEKEARAWIRGTGPNRAAVIALVGQLKWTGATPEILACLKDGDGQVRRAAVAAAGCLQLADAAPRIQALLQDADSGVRREALVALVLLQGKSATSLVLSQLRSDDADLQAAAVESLPLVDPEPALTALTAEDALKRPMTKQALAILIVHHGSSMLHRVMARLQGKVSAGDLESHIRLIQAVK